MIPLLAIDCPTGRVRRYIRRELGLGVTRLEMSHEARLDPPLTDQTCAELEEFRNPPTRRHVNVPPQGRTA